MAGGLRGLGRQRGGMRGCGGTHCSCFIGYERDIGLQNFPITRTSPNLSGEGPAAEQPPRTRARARARPARGRLHYAAMLGLP